MLVIKGFHEDKKRKLLTLNGIVGLHVEIRQILKAQLYLLHPVASEVIDEIISRIRCFLNNVVETEFDLIEWQ
jgi:hypothetical protein